MLKINDIAKTEELDREAMQAVMGGFDLKAAPGSNLKTASKDGTLRITSGWYVDFLVNNNVIAH
jgi:hypothetical protein